MSSSHWIWRERFYRFIQCCGGAQKEEKLADGSRWKKESKEILGFIFPAPIVTSSIEWTDSYGHFDFAIVIGIGWRHCGWSFGGRDGEAIEINPSLWLLETLHFICFIYFFSRSLPLKKLFSLSSFSFLLDIFFTLCSLVLHTKLLYEFDFGSCIWAIFTREHWTSGAGQLRETILQLNFAQLLYTI